MKPTRSTYIVVRVNGDHTDTHAAHLPNPPGATPAAMKAAIRELIATTILPDDDDELAYALVNAKDAGAARIMRVSTWYPWPRSQD